MQIRQIIKHLESIAPLGYQEPYDNSGLLVGDPTREVINVLVSLDVTEEVVAEAESRNCQMIIAHHPLIFGGLKKITGSDYVQRTVIQAIKKDIAVYAIHTNLDNVVTGVNNKIGEILGIGRRKILEPKKDTLYKLVVFTPSGSAETVQKALFEAGAGHIGNYSECSFSSSGRGSFKANEEAQPYTGERGSLHYEDEVKVEVIVPAYLKNRVVQSMVEAHPYEEVAYDVFSLENTNMEVGSGMVGLLEEPVYALDFLNMVKEKMGGVVRYTALVKDQVQRIAWCGGSGSFLLPAAKRAGVDVFITSDFKYHQFFDAENEIIIADIGHYENEQFTKELIASILKEKFTNFAVLLAETNTNPINYL